MMDFDYVSALKQRNQCPILGGTRKYVEDGEHRQGDIWVNRVLKEQPSSVLIIVPTTFLTLTCWEKVRKELFDIYDVDLIIEVNNLFGCGNVRVSFVRLCKKSSQNVKIASFEGTALSTRTVNYSDEIDDLFSRVAHGEIEEFTQDDIEILKGIPEPNYSQELITFLNSIKKWIEDDIDEISPDIFHKEIKRDLLNYERLRPVYYSDEALQYFKYIENETFVALDEVADVLSPFEGYQKMPETYEVKCVDARHFNYPLDYSVLKKRHPMRKPRLLQRGDIIISTVSADGKMKVFLLNEDPKEDIMVGGANLIIRAKKVPPEYLFFYLQSETADKYVFYNNPVLSISLPIIRKIPVAIPNKEMESISRLAFQTVHPLKDIVPIGVINEKLREDIHINITQKPFQSIMLEELIGNIKIEKRSLIADLISSDTDEMAKCFEAGAYKSCLILCGSILETVLLDWLSEIENTNYFVDDENMQINLCGVIRRLKDLYKPEWNNEARKAHDVRLKRNLVHPVKCVIEHPDISRDMCLRVFDELREILQSRGVESNVTILRER